MSQDGTGVRTAVITGASTGIGEACALRLDKNGWRVFAGVRKEADAQRLKSQASDRLTPITLDVTNEAQIDAAVKTVGASVGAGGLQGLVNNAGISVNGPLEYLTSEDLRKQLEVNVIAQIAVTRAFLELIRIGNGRIVNIGSIAGKMATPFLGPYAASKHAMEALSDSLRQELRPWGIRVALVEPGSIATPIWEKGQRDADEYEKNMPEEALMRYGDAFTALRAAAVKFGDAGIPSDRVARSVEHALTSGRPRTRYIVGFDATMQRVIKAIVPDSIRDSLVAMQLKLPTKAKTS
jgi:NAD(P)-dependent dehydrogenase (short-subunit alcohol dehydrogenase family)